jgi:TRAP-type uncharacterized transport system fused permease subunit
VSPPTALAPFAASAICGGEPFRTTLQAWKYTLPAFVVPFMFCLSPEGAQLLIYTSEMVGPKMILSAPAGLGDWGAILWLTVTSCVALVGFCVMFTGYALGHANWVERLLCLAAGCLLIGANPYADAAGFALLAAGLGLHWARVRRGLSPSPA